MRTQVLRRVRASLRPAERASVDRYLRALRGRRRRKGRAEEAPYWMLIPEWLAGGRPGHRRATVDRGVLADILAAQYCLFLYVRIHDDILDGQHEAQPLVFTADRLALTAQELLADQFPPRSPFWPLCDAAVRTTVDAITDVLRLQQERQASPVRLARAYAQVSRVLTVAAAAVCLKARRHREIPRVLHAMDELAVGNQILDDLRDIREDLRGGRFNYVALAALRTPALARPEATSPLATLLAETGLVLGALREVRRRFHCAFAVLRVLGIEEAEDHRHAYDLWLSRMERNVVRQGKRNAGAALQSAATKE